MDECDRNEAGDSTEGGGIGENEVENYVWKWRSYLKKKKLWEKAIRECMDQSMAIVPPVLSYTPS